MLFTGNILMIMVETANLDSFIRPIQIFYPIQPLMKLNDNSYFKLFANNILVKGYANSIIMDTQRNGYLPISNLLSDVLESGKNSKTIYEIKRKFGGKYNTGIDSYFSYLINAEYGFVTDEPSVFPEINTEYYSPFAILTAVIVIGEKSNFSLHDLLLQLIELGCQLVQIRIFKTVDIEALNTELLCLIGSRVKLVEVFIPNSDYNINTIKKITNSNPRLKFIIYGKKAPFINDNGDSLYFAEKKLTVNQKEIISPSHFVSNLSFYIESKNRNVGLNQKVSIDIGGEIKNYVNHETTYGNVQNTKIKDVIFGQDFQKKWLIKNDDVEKCKVCEFRYMCLSNSDIIKIDHKYLKVDTCGYNPYMGVWG